MHNEKQMPTAKHAGRVPEVPKRHTRKLPLLSCGVGSLYNDVVNKVMCSFLLVYYIKVVGLSGAEAGIVMISGTIGNFAGCFLFGFCCDKVNIPWLSARIGRRKSWHLFGTVFTAITFVLAFSRCFICTESSSSWISCAYFSTQYGLSCFFLGAVECSHISLIPQIAVNQSDTDTIAAFRAGFSYFGGVMAYIIAWIVLGQSSAHNLSPNNWKEFTIITCICTALGLVFVSGFHIGTSESRTKSENKKHVAYFRSFFGSAGAYSVSMAIRREMLTDNGAGKFKCIQGTREGADDDHQSSAIGQINSGFENHEEAKTNNVHSNNLVEKADMREQEESPRNGTKGPKKWLKDARLYKITFVFTLAVTLESAMYMYLALYLTDHLHFEKEAAAYCSLIFLCSGIVGSAVSKRLSRAIGKNWTTCIAAGTCVAAAVWFYFVTPPTKHMVYAPILVVGSGVSGLMVMALSFVTGVMWEDKDSAGFLYSFACCTKMVFCGSLLMLIQIFYPDSSSAECAACGHYIRWSFPLVLGVLALGILLFFARHCERCPRFPEVYSSGRCRVASMRLPDMAVAPRRSRYYTV